MPHDRLAVKRQAIQGIRDYSKKSLADELKGSKTPAPDLEVTLVAGDVDPNKKAEILTDAVLDEDLIRGEEAGNQMVEDRRKRERLKDLGLDEGDFQKRHELDPALLERLLVNDE